MKYLYLAPHFDDVAYSCSGHIALVAAQEGHESHLATVFPQEINCQTSEQLNEQNTGQNEPQKAKPFLSPRVKGDHALCQEFDLVSHLLPFVDAIYRGYSLEDDASCRVFNDYSDAEEIDVTIAIETLVNEIQPDVVYAPLAIGNHVDHRLVRNAVLNLHAREPGYRIEFYEDIPYVMSQPVNPAIAEQMSPHYIDITKVLDKKIDAMLCYENETCFHFGERSDLEQVLRSYGAFKAEEFGQSGLFECFWVPRD